MLAARHTARGPCFVLGARALLRACGEARPPAAPASRPAAARPSPAYGQAGVGGGGSELLLARGTGAAELEERWRRRKQRRRRSGVLRLGARERATRATERDDRQQMRYGH